MEISVVSWVGLPRECTEAATRTEIARKTVRDGYLPGIPALIYCARGSFG